MKKLFILFVILFIASACSLGEKNISKQNNPTDISTDSANTTTMEKSTYEQDLKEASSKIKDSEEFKSCMDMNVPMCIQNAGMQLAQKNQSTEFCGELSTPEQKESCVFAVTIIKIQENYDQKLCEPLNGIYKEQCIKTVTRSEAIAKNDIKICSRLAEKTGSGEIGDMMEDTSIDECIMNVIRSDSKATAKSCDMIQSSQIKEMCLMNIRDSESMESRETRIQN